MGLERLFNHQTIDEFLLDITETAEYKTSIGERECYN